MPGLFPPTKVFGSTYFDGSAVYQIDLMTGINSCIAKGFKPKDIIVDMILTSESKLATVDASSYKTISMLFRYFEINSYYQ